MRVRMRAKWRKPTMTTMIMPHMKHVKWNSNSCDVCVIIIIIIIFLYTFAVVVAAYTLDFTCTSSAAIRLLMWDFVLINWPNFHCILSHFASYDSKSHCGETYITLHPYSILWLANHRQHEYLTTFYILLQIFNYQLIGRRKKWREKECSCAYHFFIHR